MDTQEILNELENDGLRIADQDEPGWTYTYITADGERVTLWVTDEMGKNNGIK